MRTQSKRCKVVRLRRSDLNLARASMNLGFALELMAESACAGVIQGGPQLSDAQLIDSAITRFTSAVTVATAAGSAGTAIVNDVERRTRSGVLAEG